MNTEYTQDDVEEMEEQTGRIAANLKTIHQSSLNEDQLKELDEQTGNIVANLKRIEDNQYASDEYLESARSEARSYSR